MAMGRKPKPTWLKAVTGNPGKRALNADEPVPRGGIGPPPATLSDAERFVWLELVNQAAEGQLTVGDRNILEIACKAKVAMQEADAQCARLGKLIKYRDYWQHNPNYGISNRERKTFMNCLVEMGLTPSSRSRVSAKRTKTPAETPFGDLKEMPD